MTAATAASSGAAPVAGPVETVITGLGVVAPNGLGVADYWSATLAGTSGIDRIRRFDTDRYAAHVAGLIETDVTGRVPGRLLPQTDRMTRLALVAAEEALASAGADPATMPDFSAGVVTGASAGGFEFGHRELAALWSKGSRYVSAYQSFAWFYPVNTGQISIRHGLRGPGAAIVTEQAGGLDAVAKARRHLRHGTGMMLAGSVDGSISPWAWLCLCQSGRLSADPDPATAFLPFDRGATGSVPGEGGAVLVLERADAAAARGVETRYGTIAGHAATFDPRPGSDRPGGLRRAIELALADAGCRAADIDVVFADAAGVPELDRQEATVLGSVFGPGGVPVTAPKTMTGRLQAGGGALDLATAVLACRDGVIPPTIGLADPGYADLLDIVLGRPRPARLRTALILARGFGGFNSALVLRAP